MRKPSGWKDASEGGEHYWVKYTKYGVQYMCKTCQRKPFTAGQFLHWKDCAKAKDESEARR